MARFWQRDFGVHVHERAVSEDSARLLESLLSEAQLKSLCILYRGEKNKLETEIHPLMKRLDDLQRRKKRESNRKYR